MQKGRDLTKKGEDIVKKKVKSSEVGIERGEKKANKAKIEQTCAKTVSDQKIKLTFSIILYS